jgi:hypothetical protein
MSFIDREKKPQGQPRRLPQARHFASISFFFVQEDEKIIKQTRINVTLDLLLCKRLRPVIVSI